MTDTQQSILACLAEAPVTGPQMADRLDITRAAVWKHIDALRSAGFTIESTAEGYRVRDVPEYGGGAIGFELDCPATVEYHETIDSTNNRARTLAEQDKRDILVAANEQTAGRGRLNRKWIGPSGGIYVSLLITPQLTPMQAPLLTLSSAVAMTNAVIDQNLSAHIKWPNDVMTVTDDEEERKLGGVLTEVEGEADQLSWAIAGIGMNANIDPARLSPHATSLQAINGEPINRREITQSIIENIYRYLETPESILPAWRERAATLGRAVRLETPHGTISGRAVEIESPGVLVVETDNGTERVHAGDCEHLRPVGSRE